MFLFVRYRRPPLSTLADTLLPDATLFRSGVGLQRRRRDVAVGLRHVTRGVCQDHLTAVAGSEAALHGAPHLCPIQAEREIWRRGAGEIVRAHVEIQSLIRLS